MRRSTFLIFINAMILIVVFALMAQSLFIIKRLAKAENVAGQVLVQRSGNGEFKPLSQGDFIKTYDFIHTGADGKVELSWADGTRLQVMPDSDLTIKKANYHLAKKADESQFQLDNGTIFVRIMKALSAESKFEVATPTAVASVRGTIFMVRVKNGQTQVAVHKGSVKVTSGEKDTLRESLITPGRVATSSANGEVKTDSEPHDAALFASEKEITKPPLTAKVTPLRNQKRALVQGRTEAGDTITINGKPVNVLGNGAFLYRVKLHNGANNFTIVATDKHGATSQLIKTLTIE